MAYFKDLRFVVAGFPERDALDIKRKVREGGGLVEYIVTDKTSFVVSTEREFNSDSPKVNAAIFKKIPVVKAEFISHCVNAKLLVDHEPYGLTDDAGVQRVNQSLQAKLKQARKPKASQTGGKWRTARVFISSTFRDMHGERDYLTRHVFPELQERCQKLKVHVHPVDLRWGVTSEDTANALEICLTELDSCRPFFIGLLGDRYGWCPKDFVVPDEPRFDWVKSVPIGWSITHCEMEYGVLREPEKAKAAFYFRDPAFLQDVPVQYKEDFVDENPANGLHITDLKDKIRRSVGSECIYENYPCKWEGVNDDKPMVGGLEDFGKHVVELFWKYFQEEFPLQEGDTDPLAVERAYHERFVESHSHLFVGRQSLIQQIRDFTQGITSHPLVIVGQPGSGKTSLVSYFAHSFSKEMQSNDKVFVLIHFVGAAPGSTSIRPTLSRLIQEIGHLFQIKQTEKLPEDFRELQALFASHLKKVANMPEKKLVLIIDALNQLDNTNHSHSLDWLPEELPTNVRLILSTLPGDVYETLSRRKKEEISVGGLSQKEQEEIVRQTLWLYRKRLDPNQMNLLLKKTDAQKPLYLIVACEELRVFGVFEKINERIQQMADLVPSLFEEVLNRLKSDHGDEMKKLVSLITCSRGGLLETELLQLLGTDGNPLPQSYWARLYRSLQNYLRPPGESGEGVLDFFHQQLPKAVRRLFLSDSAYQRQINKELADYFESSADPEGDGSWNAKSKRGLNHVAYHQIQAEKWTELTKSLSNLAFIEAKCEMGMTYDLVSDYLLMNEVSSKLPSAIRIELAEYQRFVLGRAHVLVHSPYLTFSMALSLPSTSHPSTQAHKRYYETKVETRPFLQWVNKPLTSNPCIMTLQSHDMVVRTIAVHPSASAHQILSASDDKLIKLYDSNTGEELSTLKAHTNSVMSCAYSSDGSKIVSGGYDKNIFIWNTQTGLVEKELKGHKNVITCVTFSPNNKLIASTSKDQTVKIWDGRVCTKSIEDHKCEVMSCAFSPNGKLLATCGADNSIKLWDVKTWNCTTTISGHEKAVNSVSWSKDSDKILSASDDRKAIVWSATRGNSLITLRGHKDGVTCAVFNNSGTRIATGSHDNLITLWNARTGAALCNYIGHTGSVFSVKFTNDESQIVSSSFDRSVKLWEVRETTETVGHEARILAVAFSPNGELVATASRDKTLKIWETKTGKSKHHLTGHTGNVFGVSWSPNGNLLCSAGRDNLLIIWDISKGGQQLKKLEGHTKPVRCCAWRKDDPSSNGVHILSGSEDKLLKIWNVKDDFKEVATLSGHNAEVISCAYSNDGRRAASCSEDKIIKLWDTKKANFTGSYVKIATFNYHTKPLKSIAFSPDGYALVSGGDDNTLVEWNTRNAKISSTYTGHTDGVRGCCFSADGVYITSGATDSTFKLWNRKTKKEDVSFACLSRLCSLDSTILEGSHYFACGDGSGTLYILSPVGLNDKPVVSKLIPSLKK